MSPATWTREREQILKDLWKKGHSASEIARELGGITRNAVIGKISRMGLEAKMEGRPKPGANRPQAPPKEEERSSERNSWTHEEESALIELREKGTPFPLITDELNKRFPEREKPFFVQPVTAKYYYLVKIGRAKAVKEVSPTSSADVKRVDFNKVHRTEDDFNREAEVRRLEAESRSRPKQYRIGIMELTQQTCHWPIGDPNDADFHYCGLPTSRRSNGKVSPYCSAHTSLAYQPHERRRGR